MRGNITRRGKASWRLKFDVGQDENGKRLIRYQTFHGTRRAAEAELARLLSDANKGVLPDASTLTIKDYLSQWLAGKHGITPLTRERYADVITRDIVPALGEIELQKLRPATVKAWLSALMARNLAPRTIRNMYRVLRSALGDAVRLDLLSRNVADAVSPPRLGNTEIEILTAEQIAALLAALPGSRLHPIVTLALATGARRSELLALRWCDVDAGSVRIERSLEQTKGGLRFKSPKTKHGRRTVSLPASAVAMLDAHRRDQLALRLKLGMGKPDPDALVFCNDDGSPISPNYLSIMWGRFLVSNPTLPRITFHALRHSHASALIAAGIDVVKVSRRLGHSSPVITLGTYAHLFGVDNDGAADAIERLLG
jgi:integrase